VATFRTGSLLLDRLVQPFGLEHEAKLRLGQACIEVLKPHVLKDWASLST
jgi:hypothetical protein